MSPQRSSGFWPFLCRRCGHGTFIFLLLYANIMVPIAALEWWCWVPVLIRDGMMSLDGSTLILVGRLAFMMALLAINAAAVVHFIYLAREFCRKPWPVLVRSICMSVVGSSVMGQAWLITVCFAAHA